MPLSMWCCFDNDDIIHVAGSVDPVQILKSSIWSWPDLAQIERRMDRTRKQARANKDAQMELAVLEKLSAALNEGKSVRQLSLTEEEAETIKDCLTSKPIIYAANVSEDDWQLGMSVSRYGRSLLRKCSSFLPKWNQNWGSYQSQTELTWHLWAWKKAD